MTRHTPLKEHVSLKNIWKGLKSFLAASNETMHRPMVALSAGLIATLPPSLARSEPTDFGLRGQTLTFSKKAFESGTQKTVHSLMERPDLVFAKFKYYTRHHSDEQFLEELASLSALHNANVRTIDFFPTMVRGIGNQILIGDNALNKQNSKIAGFIFRKYSAGSNEKNNRRFFDLLNSQSIRDLVDITLALRLKKILVSDLQFLIDENGRVMINDPFGLFYTWSRQSYNSFRNQDQVRKVVSSGFDNKTESDKRERFLKEYQTEFERRVHLEQTRWKKRTRILKKRVKKAISNHGN